jgi:hypothetical protein
MDDRARATRDINDALIDVPMHDRLAALMCSIVSDEPRATEAICDFVAVTGMMARQLPAAQRLRIAWAMLEEVQAIGAQWN